MLRFVAETLVLSLDRVPSLARCAGTQDGPDWLAPGRAVSTCCRPMFVTSQTLCHGSLCAARSKGTRNGTGSLPQWHGGWHFAFAWRLPAPAFPYPILPAGKPTGINAGQSAGRCRQAMGLPATGAGDGVTILAGDRRPALRRAIGAGVTHEAHIEAARENLKKPHSRW